MKQIFVTLAGLTIPLALRYPETAQFFPPADPSAECATVDPAYMSDDEWQDFLALGMLNDAHSESNALTGKCSDVLIPFGRALFHAVALRWRGFAWLIVAASGVGKTTQFRTLDALRLGEFSMICGDRPVLDFRGDRVLVWPSPWDGKEHLHGAPASPLAGIIFLERGEQNKLVALTEREAILRAYPAWIYNAKDASAVEKIAAFETRLLQSVPIWLLTAATVPHPHPESLPLEGKGDRAAVDEVPSSPVVGADILREAENRPASPVSRPASPAVGAHTRAPAPSSPVKPSPRGEGGTRSVTNEVSPVPRPSSPADAFSLGRRSPSAHTGGDEAPSDDYSLPPLPDISASTQLLLDAVFTEAILPRD